MLAHLDGILDPADSEDLARKIAENEFAGTLAQRIGEVTKRLRLGAPKVLGKGTALDPNTVAEYLDSTLAPERMPDFEKVCLESDVHLAEVAACHHILTMIVGQPAVVDAESRQRMYAIGRQGEPVGANGNAANGNGSTVAAEAAVIAASGAVVDDPSVSVDGFPTQTPEKVEPRKPQVPDYLREGARRQKLATVMIAIAAVGSTIAVLVFKDQLLSIVGIGPSDETIVSAEGDEPKTSDANSANKVENSPESNASTQTPPAEAEPNDAVAPDANAAGKVVPPPRDAVNPAPDTGTPNETETAPLPRGQNGDDLPPDDLPDDTVEKNTPPIPPTPPGDGPTDAPDGPQQPAAAPRADRAEPVGKLVSGDQLLLRFDAQAGDWLRVPDSGMIFGGDTVVALPTFRPRLVLTGGLIVELVSDNRDATIVEVLAPDVNGTPGLRVLHGRLAKISAPGRQNVPLRIAFGKKTAVVTLSDTTTVMAAWIEHAYQPGDDPMGIEEPVLAAFIATSGAADIAVDGVRPVTLNEAMQLGVGTIADKVTVGTPEPMSFVPEWLSGEPGELTREERSRRALDLSAATTLMQGLTPTASVGVVLAEQYHARQAEGQSYAARSFGYLGRFDPLIKAALKKEALSWNWRERALDGLRLAIRRGPATAALVREAIVKEFGDRNGGVMYRMLCGYSPAELKNGADAKLVENLEHAELAFRSLAAFNLTLILDNPRPPLGYQPEMPEYQRRTWVVRWREKLQRKEVHYRDAKPTDAAATGRKATPPTEAAPGDVAPAEKSDEPARDVAPLAEPPMDAPADAPVAPPAPAPADASDKADTPPPAAGADGR
jgi:hypothetical protein